MEACMPQCMELQKVRNDLETEQQQNNLNRTWSFHISIVTEEVC